MSTYRHNALVKTWNKKPTEKEILEQVKEQPRLLNFIIDLYQGTPYKVNEMVKMDEVNYGCSLWILSNIYPCEDFYQSVLKIRDLQNG